MFDYLITGSNGYIAKILIKKLQKKNKKILTISKYKEKNNKNLHHIKSNIISNLRIEKKVNTIIHMASKNIYTQNMYEPKGLA